jgi:glucose-6-phosphate 1-dehydrogenase
MSPLAWARVITPGERMSGNDVELMLTRQPAADHHRISALLGDAMSGIDDLFTRRDIIDAQWRVVDAALDNATPLNCHERGTRGPDEAAQFVGAARLWRNPTRA